MKSKKTNQQRKKKGIIKIKLQCEMEILNGSLPIDILNILCEIKSSLHDKEYSLLRSESDLRRNDCPRITADSLNDDIRKKIKKIKALSPILFEAKYNAEKNKFEEVKVDVKQGFDFVISISNGEIKHIIGEIQFGNWALLYYDLLKIMLTNLIMKEKNTKVSLFIYILATGKLTNRLSDGIVTLSRTKNTFQSIFNAFSTFLQFPVVVLKLKE